jgi:hypothetical protein
MISAMLFPSLIKSMSVPAITRTWQVRAWWFSLQVSTNALVKLA